MDSNQWLNDIREVRKYNEEIIFLKNGHWQVKEKFTILSKYTSFFFDSHLDLIKSVALKVLSEKNPMFDLESEKRFASPFYGKQPKYSFDLKKGICETMVFLGMHGKQLKNCRQHKPEVIVNSIIRELFKDADWKLWASLKDVLPILAEADPDAFLEAVEENLRKNPCPFDEICNQESDGVFGNNYMTGLYWALESLAWSEDYFTKTILTFAELSIHTKKSKWVNGPSRSIKTILLPWIPRTTASVKKRIAALKGIQNEFQKLTWDILIHLLPGKGQISMRTYKPKYRNFIPATWKDGVTHEEYWKQVKEYAFMAVEMVKKNPNEYVVKLVEKIECLRKSEAFDLFLNYLKSKEIVELEDEKKQPIWEAMTLLIKKHRRFPDAEWVLPTQTINKLQEITDKLKPTNPEILYRHLFLERNLEFLEEKKNREDFNKKRHDKQIEALKEIYTIDKTNSIIKLSQNVQNSYEVGRSFAEIAHNSDDKKLLPFFLNVEDSAREQFINGYIYYRFEKKGIDWLNQLKVDKWSLNEKCNLLLKLPFKSEVWNKANELLGDKIGTYWKKKASFISYSYYIPDDNLLLPIKKFLKYKQPTAAIHCLYVYNKLNKNPLPIKLTIKALLMEKEKESVNPNTYYISEIIDQLQINPEVSEDDLFKIEWVYLPLLLKHSGGVANPKTLERRLSQKPDFFIEVIQLLYRSKKEEVGKKIDNTNQIMVEYAWMLFNAWSRPPGENDNGKFSPDALKKWYEVVKKKTIELGHFDVAMNHLGKVLFYVSSDPDGLWIQKSVAELLNEKDNDAIREGFTSQVFNSRGVHTVDPSGKPEKELANQWRKNAKAVEEEGFTRFALALKKLADSYDRDAERIIAEYSRENKNKNKNDEDKK